MRTAVAWDDAMSESLWQRQMAWAGFVAEEHRLHEREFRRDALECARAMMRLARQNVQILVDRLSEQGYRFAFPDEVYVPPTDTPADLLDEAENEGVAVPISLRAWIEEVGKVNLMGTHPDWASPAYLFSGMAKPERVWCTDPLVVGVGADLIRAYHEEWQCRRRKLGADTAGRFRIDVAPDEFHKANLSGGASYQMAADRPAVDAILLNERRCLTFVAYLRHSFEWAGFPGFELIEGDTPQLLVNLRMGLQRF
jgi:hypothetical protein